MAYDPQSYAVWLCSAAGDPVSLIAQHGLYWRVANEDAQRIHAAAPQQCIAIVRTGYNRHGVATSSEVTELFGYKSRNPSSGSKQRKRGTRLESEQLSGYDSPGASHARGMDWAAESRRDFALSTDRSRLLEHHSENLEWARANRPALPNPSSGAKQRARGTRTMPAGRPSAYDKWTGQAESLRRDMHPRMHAAETFKVMHSGYLRDAKWQRPKLPNPSARSDTMKQAKAWFRMMYSTHGVLMHPDESVSEIVDTSTGKPCFSPSAARVLDAQLDAFRSALGDGIYTAAQPVYDSHRRAILKGSR